MICKRITTKKGSLIAHEMKVGLLDTISMLIGCRESIANRLPDGKRPDVMRIDRRRGILFLGDGKNTETPGNLDTQVRLMEYIRWLSAHLGFPKRIGIFTICFGRGSDAVGWVETISMLTNEAGIRFSDHGIERFAYNFNVVWFLFFSNNSQNK